MCRGQCRGKERDAAKTKRMADIKERIVCCLQRFCIYKFIEINNSIHLYFMTCDHENCYGFH